MLRPKALARALASAPRDWFVAFDGVLYRALAESDLARAAESNPRMDHRFNRGSTKAGRFAVLYASTGAQTSLFEARRRMQTAIEVIAARGPQTHLASIRARLQRLLDLRQDLVLHGLGTNRQEITGNWWEFSDHAGGAPTQWLGHALHEASIASGSIYRSKYGTGDNVFVMRDRLSPGDDLRPGKSQPIP